MKKMLLSGIVVMACMGLKAQDYTFLKQHEQALTDFYRHGAETLVTTCKSAGGQVVTDAQLSAIAAVMQEKDGYIRLTRKSSSEVAVTRAAFIPDADLLSVFAYAGIQMTVVSTQSTGTSQTAKE